MAYFRLLGAQIAVGAAAIFARFALLGAGPLAVSAWRLVLAAVPFACFAAVSRAGWAKPGIRRERALAVAGLALAAHFASWIASLRYAPVGVSTLLVCTSPLWTGGFAVLETRRSPSRLYLVGLLLALCGIAAIASAREAPAPEPGRLLEGSLLALAGGLALAVYLLLVRRYGSAPAYGAALPTRAIVARTYGWAALALLAASLAAGQGPPAFADWRAWSGIAAMAFISQGLGHTGMNAALRDFTPDVVALTTLLEPPIAALLAIPVFGETLGPRFIEGGLAVLCGVALALSQGVTSAPSRETPTLTAAHSIPTEAEQS